MSSIQTHSGITLVVSSDERAIEAALKQLDPHLFLDKDRAPSGAVHFVVREWDKNRSPHPVAILDWTHDRTPYGDPIPLSQGLIQEVEERKRWWGVDLVAYTHEQNEKHERENREQAEGEMGEVREHYARRLRFGQPSRRFYPVKGTGQE